MKIRTGFVSNSSSSSFVVPIKDDSFDALIKRRKAKVLVTSEQLEILEELGFVYCKYAYASRVQQNSSDGAEPKPVAKPDAVAMYLSVDCNQDEVIEKLVRHKISFTAACHYGHETVVYRAGDKYVYTLPNLGVAYETYQDKSFFKFKPEVRKVLVTEINKNGYNA